MTAEETASWLARNDAQLAQPETGIGSHPKDVKGSLALQTSILDQTGTHSKTHGYAMSESSVSEYKRRESQMREWQHHQTAKLSAFQWRQ